MSRSAVLPAPPPPPETSLTIHELSRTSGVPIGTIRYYVAKGALHPPEFRSHNTRYDRNFLIRLRAIAALRRQNLLLAAIVPRLAAASPNELLELAGYAVPEPPPPAPEPPAAEKPPPGPTRPLAPGFLGPYRGAPALTEKWEHIDICPGVKLLVRSEADSEAWRVAREIVATFASRA